MGIDAWRKANAAFIDGAQFSKLYNTTIVKELPLGEGNRRWDGLAYPGLARDQATGRWIFGRGLLFKLLSDLPARIVTPPPLPPSVPAPSAEGLRDYQQESLELIFQRRWGRIALPTNAGKGAIISLAAKALAVHGVPTVVLCDEIAVFNALRDEITKWAGRSPGTLSEDASKDPPHDSIVLAMLPTIHARTRKPKKRQGESAESFANRIRRVQKWQEWLLRFGAALCDEADKADSTSWREVMLQLENTHWRIGFSGTFLETGTINPQELVLSEYLGPVLLRRKNIDMIERGISARPFVELVPYQQNIVLPSKEEWKGMMGPQKRKWVYDQGITQNHDRHCVIASLLDPDNPNAVIVNYIEHGRALASVLPNSRFLYGEDSKDVREQVLGEFKRGGFQNLIVSKILDRGTNELGLVVGLVFASSQGSTRQTLQRVGRGLRRAGGKEFLFLRDVIDRGFEYFENASLARVKLYNEEGFEVSIRGR